MGHENETMKDALHRKGDKDCAKLLTSEVLQTTKGDIEQMMNGTLTNTYSQKSIASISAYAACRLAAGEHVFPWNDFAAADSSFDNSNPMSGGIW